MLSDKLSFGYNCPANYTRLRKSRREGGIAENQIKYFEYCRKCSLESYTISTEYFLSKSGKYL